MENNRGRYILILKLDILIFTSEMSDWFPITLNNSRNNPYNYIGGKFRTETSLEEAERWFREREIPLYCVNDNPEEEGVIGYARKVLGDFLIDDTALGIPLRWGEAEYVNFDTGEIKTIYTSCVDWEAIETILERMGML